MKLPRLQNPFFVVRFSHSSIRYFRYRRQRFLDQNLCRPQDAMIKLHPYHWTLTHSLLSDEPGSSVGVAANLDDSISIENLISSIYRKSISTDISGEDQRSRTEGKEEKDRRERTTFPRAANWESRQEDLGFLSATGNLGLAPTTYLN